jgi:5-methylcytosine-specific restriction endonuclease McrA
VLAALEAAAWVTGGVILTGYTLDELWGVWQQSGEPKTGSKGGEGEGKRFSDKVKDQAREESGGACVFCGTNTTDRPGPNRSETDHAIPKSRQGNNSPDNAQNTCRTCNRGKGARTTGEFLGR